MSEPFLLFTNGLSRSFGNVQAVAGLDLRVPPGSIYAFLGPNGAGKTTAIRLLLGLLRPDGGQVSILGHDLRQHRKEILARTGALVESPSIYPRLTGRENLRVLARLVNIRAERINEVLCRVELSGAADKLAGEYSLGMKQRLGLAMALLKEPVLMILDEPTNGLDPAGIRDVRELLRKLAAEWGITIFLSSHLLAEVELVATHLGIIHQGRLLFQGPLKELQSARAGPTVFRTNAPQKSLALLRSKSISSRLDEKGNLCVNNPNQEEVAQVNALLVESGVRVYGIESCNHRLEDLFMQLTSKERE